MLQVNYEYCQQLAENAKRDVRDGKLPGNPEDMDKMNAKAVSLVIAAIQLNNIKGIPDFMNKVREVIVRRKGLPAVRAALAGIVAYLICTDDIIPDNLPGGIGYLDDGLVIFAIVSDFLDLIDVKNITKENLQQAINALQLGVYPENLEKIQNKINEIRQSFHILKNVPSMLAEPILEQLLTDPAMLNGIMNQFNPADFAVPQTTPSMNPNSFFTGGVWSEPGGTFVDFGFGGGGAAMTDAGIVVWD